MIFQWFVWFSRIEDLVEKFYPWKENACNIQKWDHILKSCINMTLKLCKTSRLLKFAFKFSSNGNTH